MPTSKPGRGALRALAAPALAHRALKKPAESAIFNGLLTWMIVPFLFSTLDGGNGEYRQFRSDQRNKGSDGI